MIYLVDDLELELRRWMGQPPALSKSAAISLLKKTSINGQLLCELVYNQLELRYLSRLRQKPPSAKNWRWEPQLHLDEKNTSAELNLEKRLIRQCDSDWTNAIPTASGLFDDGGRKANIDLAVREGKTGAFMELKWNSNHPVYAAIEMIGYAMSWIQARVRAESMDYIKCSQLRPALDFSVVHWSVVAPSEFYSKSVGIGGLEAALNEGVQAFTRYKLGESVSSSFHFIRLPAGVDPFNPKPDLVNFLRKSALSSSK